MSDRQRHGFVLLLVAGLIAASLFVIFSQKTELGLDLKGGIQLVYQGKPSPQTPKVTQDALNRAVDIMRERVDQLGVSEPEIQTTGSNLITVGLPDVQNTSRAESRGRHDRRAVLLRLGGQRADAERQDRRQPAPGPGPDGGADQPGHAVRARRASPNAGSMALYEAVKLASKQPKSVSSAQRPARAAVLHVRRPGQRRLRGDVKADRADQRPPASTACWRGRDETYSTSHEQVDAGLRRSCRPACTVADGELLVVPQGTVVLQAANPSAREQIKFDSPEAQFFVLKDNVALRGSDITNPQESTDTAGNPDVEFGFNSQGRQRVPERHRADRAARPAGLDARADLRPALRGRARQPAGDGPVDRLQDLSGRDHRRQRRRHHRRLHAAIRV